MGNVIMEASQINYRGGETKMSVEQALKETSGEAAAIAALQEAVGGLQSDKADLSVVAPAFSAEASYDVGDIVAYAGVTYRCTNSHEGEWDADDFAATTVAGELSSLESGLTVQTLTLIFNTDAVTGAYVNAYRVGQMVFVEIEYNPVGGTLVTNTAILTGLPAPISPYWSIYDGYTTLKIDANGILKYWYPTDTTTLTRRNYSFSYIAA